MATSTNGTLAEETIEAKPQLRHKDLLATVRERWMKSQDEHDFGPEFGSYFVKSLFRQIKQILEKAVEDDAVKRGSKEQAVSQISNFLQDRDNKLQIDNCVRWWILHSAAKAKVELDDSAAKESDPKDLDDESKKLVNGTIDSETNVEILIIRILTQMAPHLSFEAPYLVFRGSGQSDLRQECKNDKHWLENDKQKSTPFQVAAANGNAKAVKQIIHHGERLFIDQINKEPRHRRAVISLHDQKATTLRTKFVSILRHLDSNGSALQRAANSEHVQAGLRVLQELLNFDSSVADDKTFGEALEKGKEEVVSKFLEYNDLKKRFVSKENIIKALMNAQKSGKAENHKHIVHSLISLSEAKSVFDNEVAEKIIELDLKDVWENLPPNVSLGSSSLLHIAVRHQNVRFVELFLRGPSSVMAVAPFTGTQESEGTDNVKQYYALWHNNFIMEGTWKHRRDSDAKAQIRKLVVTATIKQVAKMQTLSDIFQSSGEYVNELCFDLSRFNSKSYRVSDFIKSLVNHRENAELLSYEPTLKYAEFPALDLNVEDKEKFGEIIALEHREVFTILDWLRTHKNVTTIIELKVPDRLVNPHNEMDIAKCVKDFQVEILDWRFLDLSISTFDKEVKDRIRDLHLYASGKRAAITHWLSNEGVRALPELKNLSVHIVQEMMTPKRCEETRKYLRAEFDKLERERKKKEKPLEVEVNIKPWNPSPSDTIENLDEVARRAVPKLSQFIKSYRAHVDANHSSSVRTKVAILDSGILSIPAFQGKSTESTGAPKSEEKPVDPNTPKSNAKTVDSNTPQQNGKPADSGSLWSRIKEGRSFVDDDHRMSPWLFASEPHGTQMANLICAIDPHCELYVAKVADGRFGISPGRVSRAIRWAMSKGVDIISMSFAILEDDSNLSTAVTNAYGEGIVMLCSTHDEGANIEKSWPAEYAETIAITACDEFGSLSHKTAQKYKYQIQGMDIAAGVIPFLESHDRISGSSVATAIAAGLSSLILSCDRLANPGRVYKGTEKKQTVEGYLDDMRADGKTGKSQYVLLEKFAGVDKWLKEGESINANKIIRKTFEGTKKTPD